MTVPLLEAHKITKRFGGMVVLDDVNFEIRPGEIHAICGENGAGKSTLIRVLSGYFPCGSFEGELRWNGSPLRLDSVRDGEAAGMAVIHQELALVGELSVAENLFLGRLPRRGIFWDWAETLSMSRGMLSRFNLEISPETKVGELGIAQQQLIEIARALARNPKLLILDEPTAALSEAEVDQLLNILRQLRLESVACVYISHKLDEVKSIADRITVVRDGRTILTEQASALSNHKLIQHMVGRELTELFPRASRPTATETMLRVEALNAESSSQRSVRLRSIAFEALRGEILGIGGLMGAGRSELLMHLFGLWGKRTGGQVWINGRDYSHPDPRESLRRGVMLVTEDRKRYGLVPGQTTNHNVSLSSLDAVSRWGWIDAACEHDRNVKMLRRTHFRALSDQLPVERLSGGNQQKVVLSRGLLCEPKLILLDEPTRGVDVGARREIYDQAQALADQGNAIVWVTSELPELIGISDRVLIMREGEIAGSFRREQGFDSAELIALAAGQTLASTPHSSN